MALRLRYNDTSIVLTQGQLLVGRSVECNLVVNDPLASRRHAVISMSKAGAFVTDMASKSGVLVNGEVISGACRLQKGDKIAIAGARIYVDDVKVDENEEPTDPRLRNTQAPPAFAAVPAAFRLNPTPVLGLPRVESGRGLDDDDDEDSDVLDLMRTAEAPRLVMPPAPLAEAPPRTPPPEAPPRNITPELPRTVTQDLGPPRPPFDSADRITQPESSGRNTPDSSMRPPRSSGRDSDVTGRPAYRLPTPVAPPSPPSSPSFSRPEALRALSVVAEKALALGRAEEAERVLQRALIDTYEAVRKGEPLDPASAEIAASLAAKLAHALGAGRWFDYAVELYAVRADIMPAPVVDLLLAAVRKAKPIDKHAFRRYLGAARSSAGDSPARRFVIQRLEGVQRLLDLK